MGKKIGIIIVLFFVLLSAVTANNNLAIEINTRNIFSLSNDKMEIKNDGGILNNSFRKYYNFGVSLEYKISNLLCPSFDFKYGNMESVEKDISNDRETNNKGNSYSFGINNLITFFSKNDLNLNVKTGFYFTKEDVTSEVKNVDNSEETQKTMAYGILISPQISYRLSNHFSISSYFNLTNEYDMIEEKYNNVYIRKREYFEFMDYDGIGFGIKYII